MSKNDITGDNITTGEVSDDYRKNYDQIFGKNKPCDCKERCIQYEQEYNEYLDDTTEKVCKP